MIINTVGASAWVLPAFRGGPDNAWQKPLTAAEPASAFVVFFWNTNNKKSSEGRHSSIPDLWATVSLRTIVHLQCQAPPPPPIASKLWADEGPVDGWRTGQTLNGSDSCGYTGSLSQSPSQLNWQHMAQWPLKLKVLSGDHGVIPPLTLQRI